MSTSTGLLTFSRQPFDRGLRLELRAKEARWEYTTLDSAEEGKDNMLLSGATRLTVLVPGNKIPVGRRYSVLV